MPYKNREQGLARHRAYNKERMRKERRDYMKDKRCLGCGGAVKLELHHRILQKKKMRGIWTWRRERREKELGKCDVLCASCHIDIHWRMNHPEAPLRFGPGVWFCPRPGRKKFWRAELQRKGKRYFLGLWATEEEAHAACNHKRAEWANGGQ